MVIAAVAILAIAAWPLLGPQRAAASRPYFAPVLPDYQQRDATVAFYEARVKADPQDQISGRNLAAQYLQRYRESLDVGDLERGLHLALRSLELQPQNSGASDQLIGSAYTALHRFRDALRYETAAHSESPDDSNAPAQMASLQMELGNYPAAVHDLAVAAKIAKTPTLRAVQARYDEITGRLDDARAAIAAASTDADGNSDHSAQARAWYHMRAGEMAFSAGDNHAARSEEELALTEFPSFEMALRDLARFCRAAQDWHCSLDAASKAVEIIPEPETLGYKSDAQLALGDAEGSRQTQSLIFAVERLGNAYNLNDRLLSVYYASHGIRLDDAYAIALRETAVRGDEVYAQDTLAWAAAQSGHWDVADKAARKAVRFETQDPRIQFHAGMIALHFNRKDEAAKRLAMALQLNPAFDPVDAGRAHDELAKLTANGRPGS